MSSTALTVLTSTDLISVMSSESEFTCPKNTSQNSSSLQQVLHKGVDKVSTNEQIHRPTGEMKLICYWPEMRVVFNSLQWYILNIAAGLLCTWSSFRISWLAGDAILIPIIFDISALFCLPARFIVRCVWGLDIPKPLTCGFAAICSTASATARTRGVLQLRDGIKFLLIIGVFLQSF